MSPPLLTYQSYLLAGDGIDAHCFCAKNTDTRCLTVDILLSEVVVVIRITLNHETRALVDELDGFVIARDNEEFSIVEDELGRAGLMSLTQRDHFSAVEAAVIINL